MNTSWSIVRNVFLPSHLIYVSKTAVGPWNTICYQMQGLYCTERGFVWCACYKQWSV